MRIFALEWVVGIVDPLKEPDSSALHGIDFLIIDQNLRVTDHHRSAGIFQFGVSLDLNFVTHRSIVWPDLTEELDFPAAERTPGSDAASPIAIETQHLPNAIEAETAWLNRVIQKMTLKEPVIEMNIPRSAEFSTTLLSADMIDSIDHQHRWSWEARTKSLRRVLDQSPVGEGQKFRLVKFFAAKKFGMGQHDLLVVLVKTH